jgi:RHS repeat-associated protein
VVNEMLTRVNNSVTKSPAFNAVGQKTDDGVNYAYDWDAFGRLRKVKNRTTSALVVEYTYNGLNQQIGRHADLDADGDVDSTDKWEWTIYDPRWRRAATYMVAGGSTFGGAADSDPKERYVHHAAGRSGGGSYLDSVILRDRDQNGGGGNNGAADGTLEQRVYFGQNWRADVSVLMTSAGRILERLTYSAYGVATRHPVADFNRDGFTDFFDDLAYDDCFDGSGCPSGQTADMNLDGFVDSFDYDEWDLSYAEQVNTARGVLSQNDASAAVNRLGYAGYWFEPSTQTYLVRNREYDPNTGVWDERDPMGYHDGADLYLYVKDNPLSASDPSGKVSVPLVQQPGIPCTTVTGSTCAIGACTVSGPNAVFPLSCHFGPFPPPPAAATICAALDALAGCASVPCPPGSQCAFNRTTAVFLGGSTTTITFTTGVFPVICSWTATCTISTYVCLMSHGVCVRGGGGTPVIPSPSPRLITSIN